MLRSSPRTACATAPRQAYMLWECFAAASGTSCAMCAWQYISAVGLFRSGRGHHLRDSSAMSRSAVGLVRGGPAHQLRRCVRAAAESAVRWLELELVNGKARCVYTAVPTVAASANGASRASATRRRSHMSSDGRVSPKTLVRFPSGTSCGRGSSGRMANGKWELH